MLSLNNMLNGLSLRFNSNANKKLEKYEEQEIDAVSYENCTETFIMSLLLLTILQDRHFHLLEKFMSIERLREFLPNFRMRASSNATILEALTAEYIKSADKVERSRCRSILSSTIRAVVSDHFQRKACELERKVRPEVVDRATPLVTAACLSRLDLVKLFSSLRLTTDAELSDLSQCEDLQPALKTTTEQPRATMECPKTTTEQQRGIMECPKTTTQRSCRRSTGSWHSPDAWKRYAC